MTRYILHEGDVLGLLINGGRPVYFQFLKDIKGASFRYGIFDFPHLPSEGGGLCKVLSSLKPVLLINSVNLLSKGVVRVGACPVLLTPEEDPEMAPRLDTIGLRTANAPLFASVIACYFGRRPYDHWAIPNYVDQYLRPNSPPSPYRRMLAEWDPNDTYDYPRSVVPGMIFGFLLGNGHPVYGQIQSVHGKEMVAWLLDSPLDGVFAPDLDWSRRLPRSRVIAEFRMPWRIFFGGTWDLVAEQPLLPLPAMTSGYTSRPHDEIELFKRADAEKLAAAWFGLIPWDSWRDREWMEKRLFPGTERPASGWLRKERTGR